MEKKKRNKKERRKELPGSMGFGRKGREPRSTEVCSRFKIIRFADHHPSSDPAGILSNPWQEYRHLTCINGKARARIRQETDSQANLLK